MLKLSRFLLIILSTSVIFSACKKEELPVAKEVKTNLTPSQEDLILGEVAKIAQEPVIISARERDFIKEIQTMAMDVEAYYDGVEEQPNYEAKYNKIRANMHGKVDQVVEMANDFYDGNEGKVILAKNSYVLMSYHFLENYMKEFMWTKLGLFAANEVRNGIVLTFILRQVLKQTQIDLKINGLNDMNLTDVLYESNRILMSGQISVFTDIGALGLLNHKYGQEPFLDASWLTQEAREGYEVQKQAEAALAAGDIGQYQDLQTEAAIWFGAHEQLFTLDPLWSTDIMGALAEINIWMHNATKGQLAMFGDIFVGTNKYSELLLGKVIKLPLANHDLRKGVDRVEIARNGFHTLNQMRKTTRWNNWILFSEDNLGNQNGIYNINFKP